uniref:SFRICE_012737 n=1 Tax=Spodoptera frugiperda TaxID=7108 RepID=A0A2H1WHR4_SPOFR
MGSGNCLPSSDPSAHVFYHKKTTNTDSKRLRIQFCLLSFSTTRCHSFKTPIFFHIIPQTLYHIL